MPPSEERRTLASVRIGALVFDAGKPLYQPPGSIGENVDSQNQIRDGVSNDTFPEILGVPSKQGNH